MMADNETIDARLVRSFYLLLQERERSNHDMERTTRRRLGRNDDVEIDDMPVLSEDDAYTLGLAAGLASASNGACGLMERVFGKRFLDGTAQ
jgi:hypothetical protein